MNLTDKSSMCCESTLQLNMVELIEQTNPPFGQIMAGLVLEREWVITSTESV